MPRVRVIGGGLGGTEAAWQLARRGIPVLLEEMRPVKSTPAHRSDRLAEIVCSNSFKSNDLHTASGVLKEELRRLGSLLIAVADTCRVPAGQALAIDRDIFAARVSELIEAEPLITLERREALNLESTLPTIVATGPLTSGPLADSIAAVSGRDTGTKKTMDRRSISHPESNTALWRCREKNPSTSTPVGEVGSTGCRTGGRPARRGASPCLGVFHLGDRGGVAGGGTDQPDGLGARSRCGDDLPVLFQQPPRRASRGIRPGDWRPVEHNSRELKPGWKRNRRA